MVTSDNDVWSYVLLANGLVVSQAREWLLDGRESEPVAAWVRQELCPEGDELVRRALVLLGLAEITAAEAGLWCIVCEGRGVWPTAASMPGAAHEVVMSPGQADVCAMCEGTGAADLMVGRRHPGARFAHGVELVQDAAGRLESYAEFSRNARWRLAAGRPRYLDDASGDDWSAAA